VVGGTRGQLGRKSLAMAATKCSWWRPTSTTGRSSRCTHRRRGDERRGRPPRHLPRPRRHRATFSRVRPPRALRGAVRGRSRRNALPSPATAEVIRYGITSPTHVSWRTTSGPSDGGSTFTVRYDGKAMGEVRLAVPGAHNVRNALAALACGIGPWGLTVEQMAPGLAPSSAWSVASSDWARCGGVEVVDDYAHHPTEVRATLSAAREAFPGRRLWWRSSRTCSRARATSPRLRRGAGVRRCRVPGRYLSGARAADRRA
jgi:hypothetical protein